MEFFKQNLGLLVLLFVIGFLIFAFNLNNQLFWDDTDWIINNPFVHSFSWENIKNWFTQNILAGIGLNSNYYRPFLLFTFTLNYFLGGDSPFSYHLLSNLLHVSNAILIFLFLFSIFKNRFVSFWASLIWLVHPLQTEAVTYISGRGDPLNVFFMLLILCLLATGIPSQNKGVSNNQSRHSGKAVKNFQWNQSKIVTRTTLVLLVFALLSRETAVIFPLLFMVFYISFVSEEKFLSSVKMAFIKALPYFGIVFVYGVLRLTVLDFDNTLNFYSGSNLYTESFLVRMYTFMNVLWTYARLMILPLGQHMERSVTVFTYFWNWPTGFSFMVLLAVLSVLRHFYKKENYKNNNVRNQQINQAKQSDALNNFKISDFRVCFFAVGWFFVNLSMTSGITPINAQLYEHWLYLALLGPLVLVIYHFNFIFEKFNKKILRIPLILFLIFVSVFFSTLSVKRNIIWGKPVEFFEDILKYEPDSARINNNLGNLYYDKNEIEKAEEYYWKSVSIKDNFPQPHFNLGSILQERGDVRGAIVEFEKALQIDPNFPYAYQGLSVIYAEQGDLVNTAKVLEKLKIITPQNPRIYYNLALVYLERKDIETAHQNLQEGLKYGQFDKETEELMKELLETISLNNQR